MGFDPFERSPKLEAHDAELETHAEEAGLGGHSKRGCSYVLDSRVHTSALSIQLFANGFCCTGPQKDFGDY